MNAGFVSLALAIVALALFLLAQLFDNLALNKHTLDDRLARIHTASFFAEASRVALGFAILIALIGAFS
jgi:hypothetical protein